MNPTFLQIILQATTVSIVIPAQVWQYIQAFVIAFVYGLYGYFSSTGNGLPTQFNAPLLLKTLILSALVAYAEVYLGLTGEAATNWAQGMLNLFLGILGADKAVNGVLKSVLMINQNLTTPPQVATQG